jgi:hypothetical protein
MRDNETYVNNVLMSVIGESLVKADASFLFGYDFSDIIDKYSPLLQKKKPETDIYKKDIEELKQLIAAINASTPFLGNSYNLVMDKIDFIEQEICG